MADQIKLFGRWYVCLRRAAAQSASVFTGRGSAPGSSSLCAVFRNLSEVDTTADISLSDYLPVKDKAAVYVPHTAGRYQKKRFRKASCPLVERLVNALMFAGRNTGKKL
mgnify:CR=1 FL=1